MSKTALVLLHEGFEEIEAITPIDILRRGGIDVTVAAQKAPLQVKGRNGIIAQAEVLLDAVLDKSYDAIVLPGGPGIPNQVRGDERVLDLLKTHWSEGKLIGAICAAPIILKDAGILDNKRHTAHFSVADELPDLDATEAVTEDGTLITSRGAGTSTAFSLALLTRLTDSTTAEAVAQSICLMQAQ